MNKLQQKDDNTENNTILLVDIENKKSHIQKKKLALRPSKDET